MVKRAIVVIPANDWAKEQYAITGSSIKQYALEHKAELWELKGDMYPEYPMNNKYRVTEVTQHYDQTLYLDCDIFPTKKATNIFEEVPPHLYGAVDELPWIPSQHLEAYLNQCKDVGKSVYGLEHVPAKIPNGGLLLLPREADYYYLPDAPRYWCLDQFQMAYTINFQWLDPKWNWGYINKDWYKGLHKASFIHLNGSNKNRLQLLNEMVQDYGL